MAQPNRASATNELEVGSDRPRYAIVTALPLEFAAVESLLHDPCERHAAGKGAGRRYTIGQVNAAGGGFHTVVLSMLADMGNNVASTMASLMLERFPSIECIFMVGIAAGVPYPEKPALHVRLGDIVVCDRSGVTQYDNVKLTLNTPVEHRHPPRAPRALFVEAARHLIVAEINGKDPWMVPITASCKKLHVKRPGESSDVLASSSNPREVLTHPEDSRRRKGRPRVFHGGIASANTLLKDGQRRDQLRDELGVRAIEMEGSGVSDACWLGQTSFMIVRGIADYADPIKNDDWHSYAAIGAAAYTITLLNTVPSSGERDDVEGDVSSSDLPSDRGQYRDQALPVTLKDCVIGLLQSSPSGLPIEIIEQIVKRPASAVQDELSSEISSGNIAVAGEQWTLQEDAISVRFYADSDVLAMTLRLLLSYTDYHRRSALGRAQIPSVIALANACRKSHPALVSTVFREVNSHLKRIGNKKWVWETAEMSFAAANDVPGVRPPEVVQGEIVALVCGKCWYYQRNGDLLLAKAHAMKSLELGQMLVWPRNDAFCKKCLGRITRLEAVLCRDKGARKGLFAESERQILEAIESFKCLTDDDRDDEIGDCYSLLGRTYLEAGDSDKAREAIWAAVKLLRDQVSKDYLDLQILLGDYHVAIRDFEAAMPFYNEVIQQHYPDDYERSEMKARALLKRSFLYMTMKENSLALADAREAEKMWKALGDRAAADEAYWAQCVIGETVPKSMIDALRSESPTVRSMAVRVYLEEIAGSPKQLISRRSKPVSEEIERLVRAAKHRVAREAPTRI